jgi:hypothetical protein
MIQLKAIYWNDVDDVWPDIAPYLDDAIEYSRGELTPDSIKRALKLRDMQLVVPVDEENEIIGIVLTEIRQMPSGLRVTYVLGLAGDRFPEWMELGSQALKSWAGSVDAPVVHMVGRRGWSKRLAKLGWKEDAVLMTLDLRN